MLKCAGVFVTSYGMLVGAVLKQDLFNASTGLDGGGDDYWAMYGSMKGGGKRRRNSLGGALAGIGVGGQGRRGGSNKNLGLGLASDG